MFTSTTTTTTARNTTKRRLPLFAAGAVLLAVGVVAGVAAHQAGQRAHVSRVARSAAAQRPGGGNLSQAATRGGVADAIQYGAVNAIPAGGNLSQGAARGGVADTIQISAAANPVLRFGTLEGGSAADPAAPNQVMAAVTTATVTPRPMGGYAEWLLWRSEAGQPAAE